MTTLTVEQQVELQERWARAFGGADIVRDEIERAMAYPGASRYQSPVAFVNAWLRKELDYRYTAAPVTATTQPALEDLMAAVRQLTAKVESLAPTSHAKVTINAKTDAQPEVNVYHPDPEVCVALTERFIDHMALKYCGKVFIEPEGFTHAALPEDLRIEVVDLRARPSDE